MRERMRSWWGGATCHGNRKVGEVRAEVRAARDPQLAPAPRRRAERRVRLLAAVLDGGAKTLDA
jgi:hypothetical protein